MMKLRQTELAYNALLSDRSHTTTIWPENKCEVMMRYQILHHIFLLPSAELGLAHISLHWQPGRMQGSATGATPTAFTRRCMFPCECASDGSVVLDGRLNSQQCAAICTNQAMDVCNDAIVSQIQMRRFFTEKITAGDAHWSMGGGGGGLWSDIRTGRRIPLAAHSGWLCELSFLNIHAGIRQRVLVPLRSGHPSISHPCMSVVAP